MTLPACDDWDEGIREILKEFAPIVKEEYRECTKCGCPHITNRENRKDASNPVCIVCADPKIEAKKERQRNYVRYNRVKEDHRRKDFKNFMG